MTTPLPEDTARTATDELECTACGACCHSDDPRWIEVFEVDARRMDDHARGLTHDLDGRRFMRFEGGRCVALRVDETGAHCQIYPQRPDACRWLQRGSGTCRSLIDDHRRRLPLAKVGY